MFFCACVCVCVRVCRLSGEKAGYCFGSLASLVEGVLLLSDRGSGLGLEGHDLWHCRGGVLGGRLLFCEFHMLGGLVVADAGVLLALGSCLDVSGLVRCWLYLTGG